MKLDRYAAALAVLGLSLGCGGKPAATPASATTVTSAPVAVSEPAVQGEAPRVGKAQRSEAQPSSEDAPIETDKDPRREDGRRGGFSGWK